MDPSPLWYESIRHTFILAHYVTPLKGDGSIPLASAVIRRFQTRYENRIGQANSGPKYWTPALIVRRRVHAL